MHGGSSLEAEGVHEGGPLDPESSAPRGEWFRDTLRSIARTEGFAWLEELPKGKPRNSSEWLEAELYAWEAIDPHTIDERLREVRRLAQAVDRASGGDQRLGKDLTTEYATCAEVSVLPAVNVDLERFEVEQRKQDRARVGHALIRGSSATSPPSALDTSRACPCTR